jgi:hypothetical protein
MAKRVLNRRQLRVEAEQADRANPAPSDEPAAPAKAAKAAKGPAKAPKKPRVKKEKVPERLRARWGVFDNAMKRVAIFDYNQRAAADQKVADLNTKKAGQFFLQIVKEPMAPPPAPPVS